MVMSYGMNLRKFVLVALGGVLIAAPLFARHFSQPAPQEQTNRDQAKSDQAKPDQVNKDQAPQTSSEPSLERRPAPTANSPSTNNAPEQLIVPAGTRLPLVLHN